MIQFDDHIFQMGWFNHHLVVVGDTLLKIKPFEPKKWVVCVDVSPFPFGSIFRFKMLAFREGNDQQRVL